MIHTIVLFRGLGNFNPNVINRVMAKITDLPDMGASGYIAKRICSLEIAEVTGKRHDAVIRDIRNLLSQGVNAHNFVEDEYLDKKGEKRPCYQLTKKGSLILASGYDAKLREAIIDRWEVLEKQRIAEERDPSISVSKAVTAWKHQGKSDQWITTRTQGIVQRHVYTDTLRNHGVENRGYADCTNAIYKPILGGTKKEVEKERNLPEKTKFRDTLTGLELAAVTLSECLATERIEKYDAQGNTQCVEHSSIAATNVSKAISASIE